MQEIESGTASGEPLNKVFAEFGEKYSLSLPASTVFGHFMGSCQVLVMLTEKGDRHETDLLA